MSLPPRPKSAHEAVVMTPQERTNATILVVESDANDRNNMKVALKSLGYGNVTDAPNHAIALEKMQERRVTHLIFEAKKTNMPSKEFLEKALHLDPTMVSLPTSFEPNVDDVFDLLVIGARGYISKPFTTDTLEAGLIQATKGESLSDAVLHAKDRNEALVALTMSSLDKFATVLRQAAQFETAKREIPMALARFKRSANIAQTFAKGGPDGLFEALEKFCLERSKGPASKLGRLRKRLRNNSSSKSEGEEGEQSEETTKTA